jgi:phosphoglycolate phosphatase-like HAD superfamily hydrolase
MTSAPILFDCVVFDLDGTLVATDRFWVRAARAGALRAFRELGIERELPTPAEWLSMVGLPLDAGFDAVFADLAPDARRHLQARCVEAEEQALASGGAALMPGALEALGLLRAAGVRLGIASNCGRGYLEHMLAALELGRYVELGRCLDSPGIADKADMVADILDTFGTRAAVMVGDRRGDAEAAHRNQIPHVHLAEGLAPAGEEIPAEAVIRDLSELVPRLRRRAEWIADALRRLGVFERSGAPRSIGIAAASRATAERFARDAARVAVAYGRPAAVPAVVDGAEGGAGDEAPGRLSLVAGPELLALEGRRGIERALYLHEGKAETRAAAWADLVLDASNPLGPERLKSRGAPG